MISPHVDCSCRGLIYGICAYEYDTLTSTEVRELQESWIESQACTECSLRHCSCKYLEVYSLPSKKRGRKPASSPSTLASDRWFITISLKPESDIPRCWIRTKKFVGMLKCTYVICQMDQSGIDDFKHPHIHFYVEYPKQVYKSKIIQVFSNAYVDYIGGDNFVDVKIAGDHHIKYCQGIKTDDKEEIVQKSQQFREKYNIEHYIEKNAHVENATPSVRSTL